MNGPLDSISYLTGVIAALNTEKGWREKFAGDTKAPRTGPMFAAYIALAHSELSEALDAYRDKIWSVTDIETGKPEGVGPELADALIRILDMCDIWEIDIIAELERVIAYGHTRPYQHGGRVL
jgi:NTP pyrophosphatase (non-canonical NTP hydrolase)